MAKKSKAINRYSLDTSCQIEKIKGRTKWLADLKTDGKSRFFSPYYSLYELKYGLINDWINFYYFVEVNGTQDAFSEWSDRYGREPKNILILNGLVLSDLERSLIKDKRTYLRSIEGAIMTALTIIEWNTYDFYGEFSDNEVVSYAISGRDDFDEFSDITDRNKFIGFGEYIKKNIKSFQSLKDGMVAIQDTLEDKHTKLIATLEEVINDQSRADMHNNSKKLADSVITIEVPDKWTFISKDNFHSIASDILGKKFINMKELKG